MIACANCSATVDEAASACPLCRAPIATAGLTRDVGLPDGLTREGAGVLFARADRMLTREMGGQLEEPLALAELQPMLVREEAALPSLDRLESMLTRDVDAQLDGITLSSLLDRSAGETKILKRGLVFLRKRRYAEALEWWSLNREALDASKDRLNLLLLLMEAFTHDLAGQPERAEKIRGRIRSLPIVGKMKP